MDTHDVCRQGRLWHFWFRYSQYTRFHGELATEGLIGNAGLNSHRDVYPTRASTQYCAGPGENSARPETYYGEVA